MQVETYLGGGFRYLHRRLRCIGTRQSTLGGNNFSLGEYPCEFFVEHTIKKTAVRNGCVDAFYAEIYFLNIAAPTPPPSSTPRIPSFMIGGQLSDLNHGESPAPEHCPLPRHQQAPPLDMKNKK